MFSLFAKHKHQPEKSPNVRLLEALDLTERDIKMNRAGKLSVRQKDRLNQAFLWQTIFIGGVSLCFGGLIMQAVLINIPAQSRLSNPLTWLLGVGVLIALYIAITLIRSHRENMSTGQATAFTGRVRTHVPSQGGKNPPPPLLIVIDYESEQERIFEVRDGSLGAYIEGQTYTIYSPSFDPKKILSAEHIPTDAMRR
jgi:hypothetical protein